MPGQGSDAYICDTIIQNESEREGIRDVYKLSAGSGERAAQTEAPPSLMSVIYTVGGCPTLTSQSQLRQLPTGLEGKSWQWPPNTQAMFTLC